MNTPKYTLKAKQRTLGHNLMRNNFHRIFDIRTVKKQGATCCEMLLLKKEFSV